MKQLLIFLLISVIYVTIICSTVNSAVCDPNTTTNLTTSSGDLIIDKIDELKKNNVCKWFIDSTGSTGLLHFDIEQLFIGNSDSLIITSNDDKTVLYTSDGPVLPGVILLNETNVRIKLVINEERSDRKWKVRYETNNDSTELQNIKSAGSYIFAYTNGSLELTTNYNLILSTPLKSKNLLLNIETLNAGLNGKVVFSNVTKFSETEFNDTNKPEFLLSSGQQISIEFKNFNTKNNSKGIRLHYELVDSLCSKYIPITELDKNDMQNIALPDGPSYQTQSSFKCLNIIEHNNPNAKLLLDLTNYKFVNTGDLITVLDGNSFDSKPIALIDSHFFDIYWNQLYLYSTNNKMWILFESPQVFERPNNISTSIGIRSQSQGGNFGFDSNTTQTQLVLNPKSTPQLKVVYTFEADSGYQIVLDFHNKTLPGNGSELLMNIFDSNGRHDLPFLDLYSNTFPPDIMASNTNQLKVEFNQIIDINISVVKVKTGCHSTAIGRSTSYVLNGCSTLCSWLIPKRDKSSGTFILQFSHLNLPQKNDTIIIEELTQKISVLTLKGPLTTMRFPDLILDSNQTYVLYSNRDKCDNSSLDGSQLLGVSLIYVDHDISTNSIDLTKDETKLITTSNYPNYYSVGSDHLWHVNGVVNSSDKAFITFTDLDLIQNHKLIMKYKENQTLEFSNADQLSQLSDYLVTLPLSLRLTSKSINSTQQPFSARGFTANITEINCGFDIKVEPNEANNLTIPQPLTGGPVSQCIWTVSTVNNKSGINLLEFEFTTKGKDFDIKNLQIYDWNTIREKKLLNFDYFKNKTLSSSTNSLIIVYNITDTKKDINFTLTFKQTVCQTLCGNKNRCLLPEFVCNTINDCGDYSDETPLACNNTQPIPPVTTPSPQPEPVVQVTSGINGWVVFLILCPLSIALGVMSTIYGPTLLRRFGRGRYREFQDFSEVS